MTNATGVCVAGQCQFLSCASGFRSCDDDTSNGCETDITRDESCGACGASCTTPESCQLSRAGWVCSVGPVCPEGTYDLDGDSENGCEWEAAWSTDGVFNPPTLRPEVAVELPSGAFAVAGSTADARLVTSTDAAQPPQALPLAVDANSPAQARSAAVFSGTNGPKIAVAWRDAVTLSAASGSSDQDGIFRYACGDASVPREFTSVATSSDSPVVATTTREVLQVDCLSAEGQCSEPAAAFGQDEYLAAYFPSTDAASCGGCSPSTSECPIFEPVDAKYLAETGEVLVVTKRGFVVLKSSGTGFEAGLRFETPAGEGGARYITGAAERRESELQVHLLDETGNLHSFAVDGTDIRPSSPAIGLGVDDAVTQLRPGADGTLLVADARGARLVRPLDRSARIATLSEPAVFLGDGRIVFGADYSSDSTEYSLLYFGVGRYYLRKLTKNDH